MSSESYKFEKLTPDKSVSTEVYQEAIDFVFKNSDIHNVAISGAYSAGKSSLIESYKEKNKNKRFLHLSLAHFVPAEGDEQYSSVGKRKESDNDVLAGACSEPVVKESVLEGKILNQLLHQISPDKLPQTNFKVKQKIEPSEIRFETAFTVLSILSVLRIVLRHKFTNFATSLGTGCISNIVKCLAEPDWIIVAAAICIAYAAWLISKALWLQKNRNIFKRVNLHGNEIEIFEEQDESYFDKYLNEVLYLFDNADADVIVFEDMDRFNTSQIFERLHEINRLINVQRQKESPETRPLRFFYLLRDDMFVSKDRTKFFDFIIPVIPVVDGSNSYNKFLKFFKKTEYFDKFNQSFLQSLALYVDDMRILKNIYNEFTIYISRLAKINLDCNKMLALITYKNLFPRDFSDLQLGRGFVHELFQKKRKLAKDTSADLHERQKQLQKDVDSLDRRILISSRELQDAQDAEERRYRQECLPTDEERRQHIEYRNDIEKRKERIETIQNEDSEKLAKELSDVEYKILHIATSDLKDLITRENIGELFSATYTNEIGQINDFHEIKSSHYFDLLKFLIRNGYIDETYPDYMTYFYEDSISAHDKIFLRRITDRQGAEYTYHLNDPEKVAECSVLRNVEFEQEETLNFDLLNYLLENVKDKKYAEYINVLIRQLKDTERFDFIAQYYSLDRTRQQFVIKLNEQWNGFFKEALQQSKLTGKQLKQYSLDTLYQSLPEIIQAMNIDDCLGHYISCTPEYLVIDSPDTEKLIKGFELLSVSIEKLTDCGVDNNLLEEVYRRNLYVLSMENIIFLLRTKYSVADENEILHRNFTWIRSRQEEPLFQNIIENLPTYADVMLSACENEISDTEEAAADFLNLKAVQMEQKKQYISSLTTKIVELSEIEDAALWSLLMEMDKIEFRAENVLHFFKKFGLTDLLINYIDNLPNNCDFSEIEEKFDAEDRKKLFGAVVRCNRIRNQNYELVLLGLKFSFKEYDADEIEDGKFLILIQKRILQMDEQTLRFVRRQYAKHRFDFIKSNLEDYLKLQSRELADFNEIEKILCWEISDAEKQRLISLANKNMSIVGKTYSDSIAAYILENYYYSGDFDDLCLNYPQYGAQTQKQIAQKAIAQQNYIYRYDIPLDDALLSQLLGSDDVNQQYKTDFFINGIPKMNEDSCKRHLQEMELPELCGIFDRHSGGRNYVKDNETTRILDGLKRNGWIYDYYEDRRNPKKYVVIKNPPKQKH